MTFNFSKKVLLITGKGGIGKSFTAYQLGKIASSQSIKTLIIQSSAVDALGYYEQKDVPLDETVSLNPYLDVGLYSPRYNLKLFLEKRLGMGFLFHTIFSNDIVKSFIDILPGLAEILLLGRIHYQAEIDPEKKYDLIIYDGFSSGHFYSLLSTPQAIINSNIIGPILKETQKISNFLQDPKKVGLVLVTTDEPLVIDETMEFIKKYSREQLAHLEKIILNKFFQDKNDFQKYPYIENFYAEKITMQKNAVGKIKACLEEGRDQPEILGWMGNEFRSV